MTANLFWSWVKILPAGEFTAIKKSLWDSFHIVITTAYANRYFSRNLVEDVTYLYLGQVELEVADIYISLLCMIYSGQTGTLLEQNQ